MPDEGGNIWGRLARKAHQVEELEKTISEMAQYILNRCEQNCTTQCEWWRCVDGECYLKQLTEVQK